VVESRGWDRRLSVAADGKRLVGHAGAVLLRKLADRFGLTGGLARVLPSSTAAGWRERSGVLVQLAVAIALEARSLLVLPLHHRGLFVTQGESAPGGFGLSSQLTKKISLARDPSLLILGRSSTVK